MPDFEWQRSGYCASNACVEVLPNHDAVLMRDCKNLDVPALAFSAGSWRAFIDGVKAGEFDR